MSELDFPEITETAEAVNISEPAQPAAAKTSAIADSIITVQGEVAKFNIIESGLREIEAAHPKNVIVGAINTPAGMRAAETSWRAYRNPRLEVEKARKAAKAPVLALGKAIDTFAGELETRLRAGEDHYKAQIDNEETRREAEKAEAARIEAERVAKHQTAIAVIRAFLSHCQQPGMSADRIQAGIEILAEQTYSVEHWQEFAVPAANAQCETLEAIRALHALAVEREAEAARLEAQRVEQERIAAELAAEQERQRIEQARIAAEQAEQQRRLDAQAAELKANADRIAAHQRRIDEIKQAATGHIGQSAATIAEAITAVAALNCTDKVFEEMAPLAAAAQASTLSVLWTMHDDAAERERIAAEAVAKFNAERAAESANEIPEVQATQQVLKAEPTPADATDRDAPADTSPSGSSMGAGQAAAAAPAEVVSGIADLTIGAINARIAPLSITGAGLALLGFEPVATTKTAKLFLESDWPAIHAAMTKHLAGAA